MVKLVSTILILFFLSFWFSGTKAADEVVGVVDLHAHIASHLPYGFMLFGGTPTDQPSKEFSYKHNHQQQMYVEWVRSSGIKIFVQAALVNIFGFTKDIAKRQIKEQLAYVENLVKDHADIFALARTPQEARVAIAKGKTVFVHALEGAEYLVDSKEEAETLYQQGVVMVGPIHLVDNEYGDASILKGFKKLLNWKGLITRGIVSSPGDGLTEKGKKAIEYLIEAGILVDMAHMSEVSTNQVLEISSHYFAPVIMSHGMLRGIRQEERGLTDVQLKAIYKNAGLIGLTGGLDYLNPSSDKIENKEVTLPADYCQHSIDDFNFHYDYFNKLFANEKYAVAWGSDANGFVSHYRPKYGEEGNGMAAPVGSSNPYNVRGMESLAYFPNFLKALTEMGKDTKALESSAEAFLRSWERALKIREGIKRQK